jgi:hypothetical protein
MVGDTLLEDVLPVLHLGAQAFHVPDQLGKAKRAVERVVAGERFQPLRSLGDLPEAISLRSV